jgi:hypothetical protein
VERGAGWSDVFGPGNNLSMAVGAPAHITHLEGLEGSSIDDTGLAFEQAARIRLSDTFSLTPAVFWLTRPRGAMASTSDLSEAQRSPQAADSTSLGVWAALLSATLRF